MKTEDVSGTFTRAQIEDALKDAHLGVLLMSLAHLTGDLSYLDLAPDLDYDFFSADGQPTLTQETASTIRTAAADAVEAALLGKPVPPLAPAMQDAMVRKLVGVAAPDDYLPLYHEELGLSDHNRQGGKRRVSGAESSDFHVVVIGAGMSGLLAAIKLKAAGIAFTIIERNSDVGGTWLTNTYPGCRVDTTNHIYSYSFEADNAWPQFYSQQPILLRYFKDMADQYALWDHIQFNTSVEEARFDADTGQWAVTISADSHKTQTLQANAVISAAGQLSTPSIPELAGQSDFKGDAFHSANWRHDVSLKDKKIVVIGTGASAFQFIPEIAREAKSVTVFQRSAPWLVPTPGYHSDVPAGLQWCLDNIPHYRNWYRLWVFHMMSDGIVPYLDVAPDWDGPLGTVGPANKELRNLLEGYIASQTPDDQALREKLIPHYPPGGKRPLRYNGTWVKTLKRSNVTLITDPIARLETGSVVTAQGDAYDADVIIYGTGFRPSEFLQPMEIYGAKGQSLNEVWRGDARAYLGMTVPDFPNFFMIYGPNTNIVANGSIIFFSECSVHYIMQCLEHLLKTDAASISPRKDVHDLFNTDVDEANAAMAWGSPQSNSWYKNASCRVSQNWPNSLAEYWRRTRAPDFSEYEVKTTG